MSLKKRILTGIGAMAFIALLALNVMLAKDESLSQSFLSLSLLERSVYAQTEGPGDTDCIYIEDGIPVVSCSTDGRGCCYINITYCLCEWTGSPLDFCNPCYT